MSTSFLTVGNPRIQSTDSRTLPPPSLRRSPTWPSPTPARPSTAPRDGVPGRSRRSRHTAPPTGGNTPATPPTAHPDQAEYTPTPHASASTSWAAAVALACPRPSHSSPSLRSVRYGRAPVGASPWWRARDSAQGIHVPAQDHLKRRARPTRWLITLGEHHRQHSTAPCSDHPHRRVTLGQHMHAIVQRRQQPPQRPRHSTRQARLSRPPLSQAGTAHAAALAVVSAGDLPDTSLPAAAPPTSHRPVPSCR